MKTKIKKPTLVDFYRLFLGLAILENILAFWYLFGLPSKTQNAFLAGYSLQRISAGFAILFILGVYIFLFYDAIRSRRILEFLKSRLGRILKKELYHIMIRSILIIILITFLAQLLLYWLYLFPIFQRWVFFLPNNYMVWKLETLPKILIGWGFLISLKILILDSIWSKGASRPLSVLARLVIADCIIYFLVILFFVSWSYITQKWALEVLLGPGIKIVILSVWFSIWAYLNNRKGWARRYFQLITCMSIWLCVFMISLQFAQWFNALGPQPQNHFLLLASAFLHGKIYLLNTPTSTHDLTFFAGHWFVPYPPFPVILILPFVAIWGVQVFNLTTFSVALAALAAVIVYLILSQLIQSGWVQLSRDGALWLTALFTFGTVYWWLSITTEEGFFSQNVTVFFCGLAFLSVLKKWPALSTGICLGAAVLSRPDVFVLWPALLAIAIQNNLNEEKVNWKYILKWGSLSAVPVILGVLILLSYNFVRFGNFFDFGYVTINGAASIVQNVKNYGLFSTHYFQSNLNSMFLAMPEFKLSCEYYITTGWGISIIATTPAIIYLVRKIKVNWWIGGCWCSIILSILLLSLYSNNGANQYGYRYVMDFIIPAIMIIAFTAGRKISALLQILIVASIIINYYGTISWFKSPCTWLALGAIHP